MSDENKRSVDHERPVDHELAADSKPSVERTGADDTAAVAESGGGAENQVSVLSTLKSVMLTILGVHSKKNTEEDLKGPSIPIYMAVFAVMVLVIMLTMAAIVSSVIPEGQ